MHELIVSSNPYNSLSAPLRYSLSTVMSGGRLKSGQYFKDHKIYLKLKYDLMKEEAIIKNSRELLGGLSEDDWILIEEEIKKLKIVPQHSLEVQFIISNTTTPAHPRLHQLLSYSKIAGTALVLSGIAVLAISLIVLIPPITVSLGITGFAIAMAASQGAIIFAVGMALSIATYFCNKALNNKPLKNETEVTVEQSDFSKSKIAVGDQTKEILINRFFKTESVEKLSKVENLSDMNDILVEELKEARSW